MDGVIDLTNEAVDPAKGIPTVGERGWLAKDVKAEDWTVTLSADALAEIEQMVVSMRDNPLPTILRRPEQFDIPHLQKAYEKARAICDSGVGFAVIDRLPVDDFPIAEMVDVYWTLGHFMGPNVAQKWDGTMIYDVTDTGKKYGYGVRGSATNVELVFHTDNAFGVRVPDYVGLMCKYPAKQGGLSRFCSLYTVHRRMEAKYPEALKRLYEPMHFDRQAEHAEGAAKTSLAPFFSWSNGKLRCRANSSLVRKGYDVCGVQMDMALEEALVAIDDVTSSADLWIEAPLERGQVQYLNNHELGHYRSEFEDSDDPATKRHLFRLWHRHDGGITYDG
ncbi:MAG: TauD/TfdA family dioxygenase [Alphaproteobacteria bacterium]